MLLRFSQPPPKQTVEHTGNVGIAVVDPYARPTVTAEVLPTPPQLTAKGPIVRKAADKENAR